MDIWFQGGRATELNEEVVDLGEYGRTLTMLWADSLPEPDEEEENEAIEDEHRLPSERWREHG